jgi:HK97 family phage major capsid protein
MQTITKPLREQRANIWSQMCEIMDHASSEGRAMNGEEESRYQGLEGELDSLGRQAEQQEAHAARAREEELYAERSEREQNPRVDRSSIPGSEPDTRLERENSEEQRDLYGFSAEPQYIRAFRSWVTSGTKFMERDELQTLQKGFQSVTPDNQRAAGVGTNAAGGFTVPPEFRQRIVEKLKQITSVRDVAQVITTETGATLPWPTFDDTTNIGAILAENTQVTEQDVTFGQAQIGAYMYTSKLIRVSYQLIQDGFFNVEQFLTRVLATRIGRIQNQHFTTGTGTSQPQGLVTGGTVGITLPTGNTVLVPADSLQDVIDTLDPAYQSGNLRWMMPQAERRTIRKLKDSQNRYMWEPSLQAGLTDTLLGYPIKLNNDMPAPAANAKSIAFGDFEEGYLIRDVRDFFLLRLEERYADFLQVGFVGFQRTDAAVQNANSYFLVQHSAT